MSDDSLLGKLAEEFTQRVREGRLPDIEEYATRHPGLADRIRELFPTLMLLEGMAAGHGSAAAEVTASLLSAGSVFGSYRIERQLGSGGMGIVYEAVHLLLERRVALKVLPVRTPSDAGRLERFFREARTAAALHHTNIVPVFDVGQVAGTPYFAMQYIEGRGLDQVLRTLQSAAEPGGLLPSGSDAIDTASEAQPSSGQGIPGRRRGRRAVRGPMDPSDRVRAGVPAGKEEYFRWVAGLGVQAAEGLSYAHERKVIHRDIKPSNLLLDNQGVLWIADFGLARRIEDPAVTQLGVLVGTPRYMSPEQAQVVKRPVDQRSDIYSLGATLYELLTLRPVFEGKTPHEVLSQIVTREPAAPRGMNPEIPTDLATIVMKAMAKRPEDRYQSARDLADDLQRWIKMEPIKARPVSPLGRTVRWCRRNPRVAAVTATALAIIIALTAVYIANLTRKNQEIRAALDRAELEAKALHATIRNDSQSFISREGEIRKIDQAMPGIRKVELLPYMVNHLVSVSVIADFEKEPFPGIRGHIEERGKEALESANHAIAQHDNRFVESIATLGVYFEEKNPELAERLYREALALMRPTPKDQRLMAWQIDRLAMLIDAIADSTMDSGQPEKAASLYREALQLRREILSQGDLQNVILERKLGSALADLGQFQEAEKLLVETHQLCRVKLGETNPSTQMSARALISLYTAWNKRLEKAAEYAAALPRPSVVGVRELGGKPFTASGGGPFSASWGGKQVWAFGHQVPALEGLQSSSWLWSDAGREGDKLGPLQQRLDSRGRPFPLLPLTADEEEFNRARSDPSCLENCEEHWSLIPGTIVPLPGDNGALLFYQKNFFHAPFEGTFLTGSSIALWKDPTAPAVREKLRPETAEPTLLFQPPEPEIGEGAHVWGGYLYAYGARYQGAERGLIVARVPLGQALQRNAWRFYAGNGQWDPGWQRAVTVADHVFTTVHWNWYLGKFVGTWNGFEGSPLFLSTADRPEGPWSRFQEIPLGRQPITRDRGIWMVIAHPELSKEHGRVVYVTYQQGTGPFRSETRLVELVFK